VSSPVNTLRRGSAIDGKDEAKFIQNKPFLTLGPFVPLLGKAIIGVMPGYRIVKTRSLLFLLNSTRPLDKSASAGYAGINPPSGVFENYVYEDPI
jgi:hypothetical protein